MKFLIKKYIIIAFSLFTLEAVIPAFSIGGSWDNIIFSTLVLCLVIYIIRPVLNLLFLPLNIITLNFTSWILNIVIFYTWTLLLSNVKIGFWYFSGVYFGPITLTPMNLLPWQTVIICAIIFTLIIQFYQWLLN
jgi:uncharacterized membrane protein YvlD (DUF360 family)